MSDVEVNDNLVLLVDGKSTDIYRALNELGIKNLLKEFSDSNYDTVKLSFKFGRDVHNSQLRADIIIDAINRHLKETPNIINMEIKSRAIGNDSFPIILLNSKERHIEFSIEKRVINSLCCINIYVGEGHE